MQHVAESDPDKVFLIDMVPNLKWLIRNEYLFKECAKELRTFEEKVDPLTYSWNTL